MRMESLIFIGFTIMIHYSSAHKFKRTIKAVGFSYYKILLTLGACKEKLIFNENKIWGSVTINRIFDIYYKSSFVEYKVSQVEILLVVNHSDVLAFSELGVGKLEFSGSLYLPAYTVVIFYNLRVYSCSRPDFQNSLVIEDSMPTAFFNGSAT